MTGSKTTGISKLKIHKENPFVETIPSNKKKKTEMLYANGKVVLDPKTGEVEDVQGIARVRYVDPEQFVKLYLNQLWIFFELGKPAQRVAEFVMQQVGRRAMGQGEILLSYWEFAEYFEDRGGGSRPSFLRGIEELADKNVIARSPTSGVWWINPSLLFNGDRARFVTEIRKKKKNSVQALEDAGQMNLLENNKIEK